MKELSIVVGIAVDSVEIVIIVVFLFCAVEAILNVNESKAVPNLIPTPMLIQPQINSPKTLG
jgi:hypothetical protein